jgi:hypothetical protein
MLYGPQNSCQNVQTVWKYTQKFITIVTSICVPINVVRQPWNACQYSQKVQLLSSSIYVHIKCCTASTNLYGMSCSSLLYIALKTVPVLCLGMRALLQKMLSLFFSSTSLLLSLVLSTRMLELTKNGCALLPKSTS